MTAGGVAQAHQLDVTDQASVDGLVGAAAMVNGRVDVLVNRAGRLDEATPFAVDVFGTMRVCHAVIPYIRRHGRGVIINCSSTYGNGINPDNAINWVPVTYCAAKGAVRGFTTALARDVAPEIRVSALAPGPYLRQLGARVGRCPGGHR